MNRQNKRFNIKLIVFELNFIYLAFLNFISLLISIIKTKINIFAKRNLKISSSNNLVYLNHAYISKFKAQLLLLSKYIDLNYVIKNTL